MLSFVLMAVAYWGCGGGGGGDKVSLTSAADLFAADDYTNALAQYVSLIEEEGAPAQVGAGWCSIRLGNYATAATYFSDASPANLADGNAGWSFILWSQGNYSEAISKADLVLSANPNWMLSLDPTVTKNHLIWIQAESYLELQDYANCSAKCQVLDPSFVGSLDPVVLLQKVEALGAAMSI
jgi:tetratricopeptide (TPR) repeat protein